jgi:hypothetical protein
MFWLQRKQVVFYLDEYQAAEGQIGTWEPGLSVLGLWYNSTQCCVVMFEFSNSGAACVSSNWNFCTNFWTSPGILSTVKNQAS